MAATLSALQLFFALTWVVYVIYLPALAAQAGIDKRFVPWILMMDQAIFIACDWAAGVYADRVAAAMRRIGGAMAGATLVSCAAFVALPFVAPAAGAGVFLALTALWSVTSSALRAPPMALVSRHVPESKRPWISGVYLLGLGVASALAPYLGLRLKGVDPRIPFLASALAVVLFAGALALAERRRGVPAATPLDRATLQRPLVAFALAALLAAVGFQVHFAFNTAPAWLRFASADRLPDLMPVFWIGFNVAILPATWLPRRFGGVRVMAWAAAIGAIALFCVHVAASLGAMVAAQLVAGAAWAVVLCAAFSAATALGGEGSPGYVTGLLFSMLALAALARLGTAATQPSTAGLEYLPTGAWIVAAAIAGVLAIRLASPPGTPRRA